MNRFFPVIIDPLERFWTVSSFRLAVPDHFWMFFCRTNRKNNDFLGAKNLKKKSTKTKKTKIVYFRFWSQNRFPAGEKIDFFSIFRNSRKYFFSISGKKKSIVCALPYGSILSFSSPAVRTSNFKTNCGAVCFSKKKKVHKNGDTHALHEGDRTNKYLHALPLSPPCILFQPDSARKSR